MKAKYIIFENDCNTRVLIFDNGTPHDEMARMVQSFRPGLVPVSAGFCSIREGEWPNDDVKVCGESVSLGLSSRPVDEKLIQNAIRNV